MRLTLAVGLTFLAAVPVCGAEKAIPQDHARMERRHREELAWHQSTLGDAYDKVGKKDPRWDKQARETFKLAAIMFSQEGDPATNSGNVNKAAKSAIDAGCDDPLLGYLHLRTLVGPNYPGEEEAARRMKAAAKALAASRYPASRRAIALEMSGSYALAVKAPTDAMRKEARRDYDAALALLPESVAKDERNEFWEGRWFNQIESLIKGYRKLGLSALAAYELIDSRLAKLPELKVLRLEVRGFFWRSYGWEARGTTFAPQVPEAGFQAFEKRLGTAKQAFEEAWKIRPGARSANYLLEIEKSIGGDRDTMELWFDRAMTADGDMSSACFTKLDWLDPKWHGTAEEMLAFGKACRETKNWRVGIPLLACTAHWRYCTELEFAERSKYLASPEVWSDIKSIYEEYLKRFPSTAAVRSKYAMCCYVAGKFPEAHAQFQILGDNLAVWWDFPNVPLQEMKRVRDHAAKIVTGKPFEAAPPK